MILLSYISISHGFRPILSPISISQPGLSLDSLRDAPAGMADSMDGES